MTPVNIIRSAAVCTIILYRHMNTASALLLLTVIWIYWYFLQSALKLAKHYTSASINVLCFILGMYCKEITIIFVRKLEIKIVFSRSVVKFEFRKFGALHIFMGKPHLRVLKTAEFDIPTNSSTSRDDKAKKKFLRRLLWVE